MTKPELVILNTEITDDPLKLGYADKSDPDIADILNTVGASKISNTDVIASKIRSAYDVEEFKSLPTNHALFALAVVSDPDAVIDITDIDLVTQMLGMFTAVDFPITRAALVELATRIATRAEVVFNKPISISSTDVAVSLGRF